MPKKRSERGVRGLEKPLVVPDEQIANVVRHRKAIAFTGLFPHQVAGCMVIAGIEVRADSLQCQLKRLHGVDADDRHG